MRMFGVPIATALIMGLLVASSAMAEQHTGQAPYGHGSDIKLPHGVIGISLQIGAEHVGDPAVLYVGMVHPEGPAHQAGLQHGDEVVSVDGTAVTGKSYEQVVHMIRGDVGTVVKLGVKGENGLRELAVTRAAGDKLPKGPAGSHGSAGR
ncbi:MAG TPA: PDZ domain-containing protein [Nitrospira sp.]|nr:PDZ domain-containing protein [Nitrospira sp.]